MSVTFDIQEDDEIRLGYERWGALCSLKVNFRGLSENYQIQKLLMESAVRMREKVKTNL